MKRRLFVSFVLALMLSLALITPVLADSWDVEDPCVVANEDFIWGQGWDGGYPDGTLESYYGEQSWSYYETPSDGYNLYRDDATDTGNLDAIQSLITRTPGAITGLSVEFSFPDRNEGMLYYMGGVSPDTWYWATEPRGYNSPVALPEYENPWSTGKFDVVVCTWDSYQTYKWEGGYTDGKILGKAVSQIGKGNGGYYRLDIPVGTEISNHGSRVDGVKLWVNQFGGPRFTMGKNMQFSNECSISRLVDGEWVVIVAFTEITDGKPR